jgi:hypothetical protein
MTATRRCGTLQLGWPISTHARGHAPARHAAWIAVPWFPLAPACASLHQRSSICRWDPSGERPLSQLTPTLNTPATKHRSTHLCTRTQNIATHSTQHKHPHTHTHTFAPCPSLTLLANALTRLLSGRRYACLLPGSPIHHQTRSNPPPTKRVVAALSVNRQHTAVIIPYSVCYRRCLVA